MHLQNKEISCGHMENKELLLLDLQAYISDTLWYFKGAEILGIEQVTLQSKEASITTYS